MRSISFHILLVALFLLVSCSNNPGSPASFSDIIKPTATKAPPGPAATQVSPAITESPETGIANCASEEIDQIGQSIAEPYPFTNAEEVMTWFCSGAEFEDILMALQTEELNGTPAEEMLEMRAEGLSWDDIWSIIGYIEQ